MRRPVTLTARLVVVAVGLVLVSAVLISLVATLSTRASLVARLDQDLAASLRISQGPPPDGSPRGDGDADSYAGPGDVRGQAPGTITASWTATGGAGRVVVSDEEGRPGNRALDRDTLEALRDLRVGGAPQEVDLPGLGS